MYGYVSAEKTFPSVEYVEEVVNGLHQEKSPLHQSISQTDITGLEREGILREKVHIIKSVYRKLKR